MITTMYKIECITNLHVGSGDESFSVVDSEVEKDALTGMPMISGSSIKGCLRELFKDKDEAYLAEVFGKGQDKNTVGSGTHKFLDAYLLARPMRVAGSPAVASVPVVTVASVNKFLSLLSVFGKNAFGFDALTVPDFGGNTFLCTIPGVRVEDENTGLLTGETCEQLLALQSLLGEHFAIAITYDGFDLPIVTRNRMVNGMSKVVWYEEVVPYTSVFYFAVVTYDGCQQIEIPEIVQLGGKNSVGYGFCKITKL